ncbi:MAG TPA: heparan-alpha-glucosaminide N-acetyltransferase domain-containing protein [Bryobacteraceae bacterium]|nr:heparan-alpha-glucosaminide N-acetyltransferase domain-containing protein [Bryobacteraceae bacterium]
MHPSPSNRFAFLDWLRGLAAIIMIQGHTFDAFARPESRNGAAFIFSQFFGGEAAAIFLLLTGVTYALGMNRREDLPPWKRVTASLRRARYLFLLAVIFRVQNWIFDFPRSHASDLLKVDVLNLMGATAGLLAVLALASGVQRVRWALLAALAIAAVSPLMSMLNTSFVPAPVRNYFVPNYDGFSIFPWGAFLAFGVAVGSMIPLVPRAGWNRVMQWGALCGFGFVLGGQYFSNLPFSIYPASEFWLNSPGLIFCKLGVAMLMGAGAYLWTEFLTTGWSFVRQLGTTSLVVYWTHIELTYGRWFADYRQKLSPGVVFVVAVVMVALMVGVSIAFRRIQWHLIPQTIGWRRTVPANVYTLPSHHEVEAEARASARRRL